MKKYIVTQEQTLDFKVGDVVELSDELAQGLVNKVTPYVVPSASQVKTPAISDLEIKKIEARLRLEISQEFKAAQAAELAQGAAVIIQPPALPVAPAPVVDDVPPLPPVGAPVVEQIKPVIKPR